MLEIVLLSCSALLSSFFSLVLFVFRPSALFGACLVFQLGGGRLHFACLEIVLQYCSALRPPSCSVFVLTAAVAFRHLVFVLRCCSACPSRVSLCAFFQSGGGRLHLADLEIVLQYCSALSVPFSVGSLFPVSRAF